MTRGAAQACSLRCVLTLAVATSLGCAPLVSPPKGQGTPPQQPTLELRPATVDQAPTTPDRRLSMGDRLRVSYFKSYSQEGPYYLEVGDRIKVIVESRPELTHEGEILPDGTATLPLLGPVRMRGKTVAEADAFLEEEYGAHLSRPSVDVLVTEPRGRVEDFFKVLLASPDGASREAEVTGSGVLEFPLLEPVQALGTTISETRRAIREAYAAVIPRLRVEVVLLHSQPIAVLGEVVAGGVFETSYPVTALRALALAGGPTVRAHLAEVLLIRQMPDGEPSVTVLDLKKFLDGEGLGGAAEQLMGNDVLYVPLSPIAKANVFVDQYFRKMWPVETGFGLGAAAQIK